MFPGAAADRAEAAYVLVGAPLDASTTGQPGTRYGPREVRQAAATFEDYDRHTDRQFSTLSVHDAGDVEPTDDVEEYLDFLEGVVGDCREEETVPLVVGGEHTVTVAAVRALDPDVVVCLDAHLDLREAYAGNPLSHATTARHALDAGAEVVVLGARAGSEREWERADRGDVTVVPPGDVPDWEPEPVPDDKIYLSVDIDAADPGFAPGTGTPEPFGLSPATMRGVVRKLAPAAVGFDVVEVNDRDDGQAATLAAKLLRAFVYAHADG
jgi:agmatinase